MKDPKFGEVGEVRRADTEEETETIGLHRRFLSAVKHLRRCGDEYSGERRWQAGQGLLVGVVLNDVSGVPEKQAPMDKRW